MKYTTCFRPAIAALIFAGLSGNAISAQGERVQPKQLIVDKSLPQVQLKTNEAVAREYATFWNTGNETLARDALAANFVDKTPPEGRKQAYDKLMEHGIDALVAIGGDGTLTGARIFAQEFNYPIVGLPGTIDNDLYGTDITIGYDTALNTIMECVDKIRDTATSHDRLFFIEVMGRDAGFLALNGAIASGAEAAIIPEISMEKDQLAEMIETGFRKSKNSSIVLVAESEVTGGAMGVAERVKKEYPQFDVRVSILGHLQRGGSPTAQDRILATRMGVAAVDALLDDQRNVMMGIQNDEIVYVPFSKAIKNDKPINRDLLNTLRISSI